MIDTIVALIGTRQCISDVNADVTETLLALDRHTTLIVTGDASGVDAHVKRMCEKYGYIFSRMHARKKDGKWEGKWCGPERNGIIARISQRVTAWPAAPEDQRALSAGSWDCIDQFRQRGKPVDVRDVAWRMR
jgi:hypothetical protein